MSPRTKAVLFDFDLTLADSTVAIVECVQYSLRTMGRPVLTAEVIQKSIGLTLAETFVFLSSSRDPQLIATFSDLFIRHADRVMVALTTLYPGVATLLRSLRSLGISTAIVSTKYRYRIEAILAQAGLQSCVDVIVGGEEVNGSFENGVGNGVQRAFSLKREKSSLPATRKRTVRIVSKRAYPRALRFAA